MTPDPSMTEVKTWFQKHERMVIVALVLLVTTFLGHRTLSFLSERAEARATIAEQALSSQKTTDAQLAANTSTITAQYQAMVQQLIAQNTALASAVTARQGALQVQKGTDALLAPSGLVQRLSSLAAAPPESVLAVGDTVVLTQPGAVAVAQTLEEVPVLQANLNDINQINVNLTKETTSCTNLVAAQAAQVTGLKTELLDQTTVSKAELAKVKAEGRKSKLRWFGLGFMAGFLSRGAL